MPKSVETTRGRALPKVKGEERLPGRLRKDMAVTRARAIAMRGGFEGFRHVLETYERENPDDASLRLWSSASDRMAIDFICAKWKRAQPKRRP